MIRIKLRDKAVSLEFDIHKGKARWNHYGRNRTNDDNIWGFNCRWNDEQKYFETHVHANTWVKASEEQGMSPGGAASWFEVDELYHAMIESEKILLGIEDDKALLED